MAVNLSPGRKPFVAVRGIHLDLKGLPPSSARLPELLEIMAGAGINCVLVEWEDAYPWKTYPELGNRTAYSERTVDAFLGKAEKLSIEVIPLVQSLGHLENVLSKKRFRHLRELDSNVAELCPSRKGSAELIISLVDDILSTHGGRIKRFHLGGDEAEMMGSCRRCKKTVSISGKASLYLRHVTPLLEHLKEKGIQPILWDDMMREWSLRELRKLAGKTDLMVWWYSPEIPDKIKKAMTRFSRAGINIWGASAFKGADGVTADVPDIDFRTRNILSWIDSCRENKLEGLVATGWSRYNTFVVPCESIETSLDSLVLSAWAMQKGSLPPGSRKKAWDFLRSGRMKKLAGKRFFECRDAGAELQRWRKESVERFIYHWPYSAHLYGEKERCNPMEGEKISRRIEDCLAAGRKAADRWRRAHKGLVDGVWLEYYVESRLRPVKDYAGTLLEKLSRKT